MQIIVYFKQNMPFIKVITNALWVKTDLHLGNLLHLLYLLHLLHLPLLKKVKFNYCNMSTLQF